MPPPRSLGVVVPPYLKGLIVVGRIIAVFAVSLMLAVTTAQAYPVQITHNVPYGPDPSEILDICRPIGAPSPMPAFVIIHAGGWVRGDKSDPDPTSWCTQLAQKGYLSFAINYRLVTGYQSGAPLPNPNESNTFPAALNDTQLAVRWIRSRAPIYAVDVSRVCALGFSAGGHLATFLGALKTIYPGDVAGQLARFSPGVACVSAASAPADLSQVVTGPPNSLGYQTEQWMVDAENTMDNLNLFQAASPTYNVSSRSAPTSIMQGTADTIVFPSQASAMEAALQASGVAVQILWYDGGHMFQGLGPQQAHALIDQSITWALSNARWP